MVAILCNSRNLRPRGKDNNVEHRNFLRASSIVRICLERNLAHHYTLHRSSRLRLSLLCRSHIRNARCLMYSRQQLKRMCRIFWIGHGSVFPNKSHRIPRLCMWLKWWRFGARNRKHNCRRSLRSNSKTRNTKSGLAHHSTRDSHKLKKGRLVRSYTKFSPDESYELKSSVSRLAWRSALFATLESVI